MGVCGGGGSIFDVLLGLPNMTLNVTILIWKIGSQRNQKPALILFQSCHFSHIPMVQERFSFIRKLQKSNNNEAQIEGMWGNYGRWIK